MKDAESAYAHWNEMNASEPVWHSFFMVCPLVVIGTKEGDHYDLAPKHMVTALGQENYFGFVCTPDHATYHNAQNEGCFTVSFIRPDQVILASLAATPRAPESSIEKKIVNQLATVHAKKIDSVFLRDASAWLECTVHQIFDAFGKYSLVSGKVVAAYVHEDDLRTSEKDEAQMIRENPLLAYLAYGRFAEIRNSAAFPFPKGFEYKNPNQ